VTPPLFHLTTVLVPTTYVRFREDDVEESMSSGAEIDCRQAKEDVDDQSSMDNKDAVADDA
jgi:hypothetical protein